MKMRNISGLTLTETMVSVAVFSYFSLILFTGISAMNKINYNDSTQKLLQNKARMIIEKIVWGAGLSGSSERDGIAEAESYTVAGNTVHYTLPDGKERKVVQSQDELTFHLGNKKTTIYDPNGPDNAPEPQKYSTSLNFTEIGPRVVQVDVVLGEKKNGVWYYASLSTAVALRN